MKKRSQSRMNRSNASPVVMNCLFTVGLKVLCVLMVYGTLLTIFSARADAARVVFDKYEILTGPAKKQTALIGFLLNNTFADVAVINVDENNDRRLRIYSFADGKWSAVIDAVLGREVLFVDVASIGGRERLIIYEPGNLKYFDTESETESDLLAMDCSFEPPRKDEIPHLNITRDLNGDDRDDFIVPVAGGFSLYIQLANGGFAKEVRAAVNPEKKAYDADGYKFDSWIHNRIYEIDYNLDGLGDLIYWNENRFEVRLQKKNRLFGSEIVKFNTGIQFDSDDPAALAAPYGVQRRRKDHQPEGSLTGRVLHSIRDMNGDGVADLVVFSLQGGSLWNMHSAYEVHYGRPHDGVIVFAQEVGALIRTDGIPFEIKEHDIDGNGQIDTMLTIINPSFFKVLRLIAGAVFRGSAALDLRFHLMKNGTYPEKPAAKRGARTVAHGKSGAQAAYFPAILFGDVNGDGRSDLLIQKGQKQLNVYPGTPTEEIFARRPYQFNVKMPKNKLYTWLVDINRDQKTDILMHNISDDKMNRVTILVAG